MANNFLRSTSWTVFAMLSLFHFPLLAQKQLIDTGVEKRWPGMSDFVCSNNGRYGFYYVEDRSGRNLILQATNLEWKIIIPGAIHAGITQNSEKAFFRRKDSLFLMDLTTDHGISYIKDVSEFEAIKNGENKDLLFYRLEQTPGDLTIRDVGTGRERVFSNVENYWADATGNIIIFESKIKGEALSTFSLTWWEVSSDSLWNIWKGRKVDNVLIDETKKQCVFAAAEIVDSLNTAVWIYRNRNSTTEKIIDEHSVEIKKGFFISDVFVFNGQDGRVYFYLKKVPQAETPPRLQPVDIWSYKDARLQSEQLYGLEAKSKPHYYKAVLNINSRTIVQLEDEKETIISNIYSNKRMRFLLGVRSGNGDVENEWNWNKNALVSIYIISLMDGEKKWVARDLPSPLINSYILSYNENYVFYYDPTSKNYISYSTSDCKRNNMTSLISTEWTQYGLSEWPKSYYSVSPYRTAGIVKNEDIILVYSQHDIYELNPEAKVPAVNLTQAYKSLDSLEVRFLPSHTTGLFVRNGLVTCRVFSRTGKKETVVYISFDSLNNLKQYQLQPFRWNGFLTKARDTALYFLSRATASESSNIWMTDDFKTFQPVTNLHPEKEYNWMTSEMIVWQTLDGSISQGILYKPENFDSKKKYPLLVYYYEQLSDDLYKFLRPEPADGRLNIPFYVSRGYLVFVPDIHYKTGFPGKSAYNCVVSGVKYLCQRKYVDGRKMGLQGHSFGGFETNYIITHSHLFAAAMSASGMTDFISAYGSIIGGGTSRQRQYEFSRDKIGGSLWEKSAEYLENSPVLKANEVTTPILIMANKADEDVPWQQGIELFTALRRLGKKAWMLQYDGQGHSVDGDAANDLTIRMFQFFNYYLKGEPPPKWMTKGVPAELKGIDSGLELDTSGEKP